MVCMWKFQKKIEKTKMFHPNSSFKLRNRQTSILFSCLWCSTLRNKIWALGEHKAASSNWGFTYAPWENTHYSITGNCWFYLFIIFMGVFGFMLKFVSTCKKNSDYYQSVISSLELRDLRNVEIVEKWLFVFELNACIHAVRCFNKNFVT